MDSQVAGWYPDPNGGRGQRYWDGTTWTEHNFNLTPPVPTSPPVNRPSMSITKKLLWTALAGFVSMQLPRLAQISETRLGALLILAGFAVFAVSLLLAAFSAITLLLRRKGAADKQQNGSGG